MPAADHSPGAWQRAETTSVVWQTIAPVRRVWVAAEALVSSAVAPRESADEDARALNAVRSSRLVRAIDRVLVTILVAWRHSIASAIFGQVARRVTERTASGRVRLAGGLTASASATVLVAHRLTPRPEPLTWIVPALFLVVGVCLMAAAYERPAR
jgi:hypothetical protein